MEQFSQQRHAAVLYNSTIHINNVSKGDALRSGGRPGPIPPSLPPPSMPITVIPIPVLPVATLSPPAAPPPAATLPRSPLPKPEPSVLTANHKQLIQSLHPQLLTQTNNAKLQQLVQRYPGSIVSPPQQHAILPQTSPVLQQAPLQNGPASRGSPPDDGRLLDKKRPGGRAHLKECFETLKKNIPNIDEKKTSNLSVLRSALRYIQTLKRKEKEYEHDMERLAREKIATQQRLAELKNELSQWMDVMEVDRVLRQTVQPEEDQASTSTASEGEDIMDEDLEEEIAPRAQTALPTAPTLAPSTTSFITQHISIQHKVPQLHPLTVTPQQPGFKPAVPHTLASPCPPINLTQTLVPTQTQMVTASSLHPTVIARASVSHPSVIQAVNHVIHGGGHKHIAHLASSTSTVQLAHQPIGHITVHPVAHLHQHLYPQQVAVTQSAMMGHITHTINHAPPHMNGTVTSQPAATIMGKQTAVNTQMVTHHPQLVGQTVLNPLTMVTMPSFPIGTLKLA
ncbi:hypothetical protein F7725_020801 [Dissostichus mawsoni]|uniref:Max-binding protein MNT n=1 Tax=Dissostichus mawsoni TaxID=36200 RepID=A0A7J5YF57_DISMA|nr:hypothetical protein F7725_020801 [Dissostichus mawsoni]